MTDTTSASTRNPVSLSDYEAHLFWLLDRTDLTDDERFAGLRSANREIGAVAWSGAAIRTADDLRLRYRAEIDRLESAGADWCAGQESLIKAGKASLGGLRVIL